MPDFFGEGQAFGIDKLPAKTEQDKKDLQAFFGGAANPPDNASKLADFANVLKGQGFKKIGAIGYCWGTFEPSRSARIGVVESLCISRWKGCHLGCIEGGFPPRRHFECSSCVGVHPMLYL